VCTAADLLTLRRQIVGHRMGAGDGLEHTVLSGSKRPTGVDGARPQNDPHRSLYDGLVESRRRFLFRRSFDRSAAIANVEPSRRHRFRRLVGGETLRRRRLPPATERPLPPPPPLRSPTDDATDATDRRLLPAASLGSRRSFRRRFCVQPRQYHVLPLFALQSVRICRKRSADDRFLPSAPIIWYMQWDQWDTVWETSIIRVDGFSVNRWNRVFWPSYILPGWGLNIHDRDFTGGEFSRSS